MALTQPSLIPQPWGSDGQVGNIPQDSSEFGKASWAKGFPTETAQPLTEGGIPPSYLDFQGVLNALSAHAVFMQSGAHYAWSNTLDYPAGCFVLGSDGKLYQALQASGPGYSAGAKNPTTSATYWQVANLAEYLKTSGGKMLGELGMLGYGRLYGDAIKAVFLQAITEAGLGGAVWCRALDASNNPGTVAVVPRKADGGAGLVTFFHPDGRITTGSNTVLTTADSATIAGYAMPGQSRDIPVGANGATYTAPENGYFNAQLLMNASPNAYLFLTNRTTGIKVQATHPYVNDGYITLYIPCRKNDAVELGWLNGTISYLKFYQVNGV